MADEAEDVNATRPLSIDERRELLDGALIYFAKGGWRVEHRTDVQATIAKGKPTSHLLHLFLAIITLGVWLIVWLVLGIGGGVKRKVITITEYGMMDEQKVRG